MDNANANPLASLAEFQRLCELRDMAAYRAVGSIQAAVSFWEAQEYEETFKILKAALVRFNAANDQIKLFHARAELSQLPKTEKEKSNGNRTAAA